MNRTVCSVNGCNREAVCKGFCMKCYCRAKNNPKTSRNRKSLLSNYAKEWQVLNAMRQRCYNPNSPSYKNYGMKGIKVCDRWMGKDGLKNFIKDMGHRPDGVTSKGHPIYTIDRIDSDGPYSPDNCRWSTWWEQNKNTSRNRRTVGVYRVSASSWRAELTVDGHTYRKQFKTEKEAIDYRAELERKYLVGIL